MNPEVFAEWLRRQGHRVVRTASSYWYDAAPGVFQAFPYHWLIAPEASEVRRLLVRHGAGAARFSAPFEYGWGVVSYHVVLEAPYDLDLLKAQARNGVKAGLGRFAIGRIPFERLAVEGWELQRDTLERQGRLRSMTREAWEDLCYAACGLPGFEAWAATAGDELAAAVIAARIDDRITVPYALSHRRFLGDHVNNALFYRVSRELLGREGVSSLFFTVQSLDAPPQVDEFKFRMGLQPRLVRQCVVFHPLARPFARPWVHGLARRMLARSPGHPLLAKAEGMLRFHLEGRKRVEEQTWPEPLVLERDRRAPGHRSLGAVAGIQVTTATPFDHAALVALHEAVFTRRTSLAMALGHGFRAAAYRWLLAAPECQVLVARKGNRVVGFTAVVDRPYLAPLLRACQGQVIRALLARPWLLLDPRILRRWGALAAGRRQGGRTAGIGQVAYTAVDPSLQEQGIGKALKEASIRACRERGLVALTTGVDRRNLAALRLNELAGFVEVPSLGTRRMAYLRLELSGASAPAPERPLRRAVAPAGLPGLGKRA